MSRFGRVTERFNREDWVEGALFGLNWMNRHKRARTLAALLADRDNWL